MRVKVEVFVEFGDGDEPTLGEIDKYIEDAICRWGGTYHPDSPFFPTRIGEVIVLRTIDIDTDENKNVDLLSELRVELFDNFHFDSLSSETQVVLEKLCKILDKKFSQQCVN